MAGFSLTHTQARQAKSAVLIVKTCGALFNYIGLWDIGPNKRRLKRKTTFKRHGTIGLCIGVPHFWVSGLVQLFCKKNEIALGTPWGKSKLPATFVLGVALQSLRPSLGFGA